MVSRPAGLPLLPGPVAQPPAEWQLSQTPASSPLHPLPGPNKGKTKIHFPLSESGEGEPVRVIRYCVLGPTLLLT